MALVKQALGAYLVLTAIAVAALLILTPLTHDGGEDYPVWDILNYFMAVGTVVALIAAIVRKMGSEDGDLGTTILFYGAIVLTMFFFWEWFWNLNPDSETGLAVTSHIIYFPLMDAIYTVVCLATGKHLWRTAGD